MRISTRLSTLFAVMTVIGCAHRVSPSRPFPVRVVQPLASSDLVCAGLQVPLDSIATGHSGTYFVLGTRTTVYNQATRVAYFLNKLIDTPLLLANTWRSFQEQNLTPQLTCDHGTQAGSIVHGAPGKASTAHDWSQQFRREHAGAIAAVGMSGPGLSDDGSQLFLMLDVAFANGESYVFHVLLIRSGSNESWRVAFLTADSMNG